MHFILLAFNFRSILKQFAIVVSKNKKSMQNHIFNLIHKLFICWLLAFCSSFFIYGFVSISNIIVNQANLRERTDYISVPLLLSVINLDSLINNMALSMQFEFGYKLYSKLCNKCCQLNLQSQTGQIEEITTYPTDPQRNDRVYCFYQQSFFFVFKIFSCCQFDS